jgi:hypothetical protein
VAGTKHDARRHQQNHQRADQCREVRIDVCNAYLRKNCGQAAKAADRVAQDCQEASGVFMVSSPFESPAGAALSNAASRSEEGANDVSANVEQSNGCG